MSWIYRTIAFAALLLGALSPGFANDNDEMFIDENIQVWVGLTSHEKDKKVSGTNENCAFQVSWGAIPDYEGSTWDLVSIVNLRVECDDMDLTFTPPGGPVGPTLAKTIRIATTHFNDDSTITFTITGTISFVDSSPGGMASKSAPFTHTATLKAYNKGLPIASNVNEEGEVLPETHERYPLSVRRSGKDIATYAIASSLGPSSSNMRHTMNPSSATGAQALTESQIHPLITSSTVIVAVAHADPYGFCDAVSHVYTLNTSPAMDGYVRASGLGQEVGTLVSAKGSTIPKYNLALMWCCDTLRDTGLTNFPGAFSLLNRLDAAYAGFDETVAAWLKPGDQTPQMPAACQDPLSKHGERVLELLKGGSTIAFAVAQANGEFPPRQITPAGQLCPYLPMMVQGDGLTRLFNVYLTEAERLAYPEAINSWFFIVP